MTIKGRKSMRKLCAILICISLIFLPGCRDEKEMNEIGIVTGIAIDKDLQNERYIITLQVILPANMQKKDANKEKPYKNITGEGDTIFDAQRSLSKKYERIPFYSHNRVVIINENVAKEGLSNVLDVFTRDNESRDNVMLVISKDTKASNILDYENKTEQIPSISLSKFENILFRNPGSVYKTVLDFKQNSYSFGIDPVLGVFSLIPSTHMPQTDTNTKKAEINYAGSAVFVYDKLQGFLNEDETEAYNFVTGKVKSAVININGMQNKNALITTQVLSEQNSIVPHLDGSQISFNININDVANIDEIHDNTDVTDVAIINKLENEHNEKVKAKVEALIKKMQTEYKSDIFGLGQSFYRKYPHQWEKIKNNWSKIFPTIRCKVTVKSTLVRSGLTDKRNNTQY
ncbi:MAG TPA: Ger(x)C family spore germination protein [Ruminiclostridium sp.]|nr:Ger(x)C family spore germination protein [Ruminiclostridium sp.]